MEEDIDPIVYSRQEVIVEKIMFPEGLGIVSSTSSKSCSLFTYNVNIQILEIRGHCV